MWLLRTILVLLVIYQAQGCQPELKEDAASLLTVGYDKQGSTAVYVDTLSVEMKGRKQKFSDLLKPGCNGRKSATLAIEVRKEGTEEWEEKAKDIRITRKNYDNVKDLDPCSKYEVRVLIKPTSGGEIRELSNFPVGPFHKLDPEEKEIAQFKSGAEEYYTEHFKPEYTQVSDNSFTVKWEPVCALVINVWLKEGDWKDQPEKVIKNDIENPTTELTLDVEPCKQFEVMFEISIDSEGNELLEEYMPTVTTDPDKEDLSTMFSKHSYENISNVLKWDYTAIDEFACIKSFSYKLVKDENGEIEELSEGNDKVDQAAEFSVGSLAVECNFGVRMEVEHETVAGQKDSLEAFEEHIHKKDQKENAISINGSRITYTINPCVEPESEIVIGLKEIGRDGKDLSGRTLEENLEGIVKVDKSKTDIERSSFDETELKPCVAYKIMLLRKTADQDFKELETAEFENSQWNSWKAPSVSEKENTSTSITLDIADLETDGECLVSHYNISCQDVGGGDTKQKMFHANEELKMDDLLPETKYNCAGRIVHTIPGSGAFETPWSDFVVIETASLPLPEEVTTIAPVTEVESEDSTSIAITQVESEDSTSIAVTEVESDHEGAEMKIGLKSEDNDETILALSIAGICFAIIAAGGCYWWHCIRDRGQEDSKDINLSYRASATAGTKVVDMNSALLTETEEEEKKEAETDEPDIKETVVEIPEENKATTSTEGTPNEDVNVLTETEDEEKKGAETDKPDKKETVVEIPEEIKATTSTEGTPSEDVNVQKETESSSTPADSEGSPSAEISPKDTDANVIP
eukprot:GFUD01104849.1.p1 GENE.GFUD01104849.1~~GFUD01104849.1.p1  ORF type:complete len:807 (+),score=257.43 GFUD01104849.1:61-2481(+)